MKNRAAARLQMKRVGEPSKRGDGQRVLVDRLWPRGVSKQAAKIDVWLKEIAPSTALRLWFGHDPAKWMEFQRRYYEELDRNPEGIARLRALMETGPVTLIYGSRSPQNNSLALFNYLGVSRKQSAKRNRGGAAE